MHQAWPKAHHMAPPDLAIRQRQLCSGARPSAQPKSLARRLATESGDDDYGLYSLTMSKEHCILVFVIPAKD